VDSGSGLFPWMAREYAENAKLKTMAMLSGERVYAIEADFLTRSGMSYSVFSVLSFSHCLSRVS